MARARARRPPRADATEAVRAIKHAFPKHLRAPANGLDRAVVIRVLDALAMDGKTAMANSHGGLRPRLLPVGDQARFALGQPTSWGLRSALP